MADPYSNPDVLNDTAIAAIVTRLEERGRHPGFAGMIQKYAKSLPNDRPLMALDLGCGTGVVIRQLAAALHPASILHGADISGALLKEAERLTPRLAVKWDHLTFGPLPYENGTFDVVTMHTLLSHVPDPVFVLTEARRILKPTGRLIVFDADHAGTTYNQPQYATTHRFDQLIASAITTHPDICRQFPRLLKSCGYELAHHSAEMISECGQGNYWLSSVRGLARLLPTTGALTASEAESWASYMHASHENGTFFAAGAFYTFYASPIAFRPEDPRRSRR